MIRKNIKRSRGQSLLEFALILPLMLLLITFIVDLGRVVVYYSTISNAAREGARYGVMLEPETSSKSLITNKVEEFSSILDKSNLTTTICFVEPVPSSYTVSVAISYAFEPATPFVEFFLGAPNVVLNAKSTMWMER
jgi:Flp pilus assembly protein TadG